MTGSYTQLLEHIPKVTKNEASQAIDTVLNAISQVNHALIIVHLYSVVGKLYYYAEK